MKTLKQILSESNVTSFDHAHFEKFLKLSKGLQKAYEKGSDRQIDSHIEHISKHMGVPEDDEKFWDHHEKEGMIGKMDPEFVSHEDMVMHARKFYDDHMASKRAR